MIRLEHIEYLNYLWVIPALLLLFRWFRLWKSKTLRNWGNLKLYFTFDARNFQCPNNGSNSLLLLKITECGYCRPRVGSKQEKTEQKVLTLSLPLMFQTVCLLKILNPTALKGHGRRKSFH